MGNWKFAETQYNVQAKHRHFNGLKQKAGHNNRVKFASEGV